MSILSALKKNSVIEGVSVLSESKFFDQEVISIEVPILNLALSGDLDGGLVSGFTVFAGPSKHGKSIISSVLARSYMKKYDDAIMLFYDSEFGTPQSYFESLDIDPSRILHMPLQNIEQLKFDIVKQLEMIKKEYPGAKVFIYIDSFGNVASAKEVNDALDGSSKADMTRAKELKSLFRIVTPYLRLMNIPMVGISHSYNTMEMYSKAVVSGGNGIVYSADNVYIMGRQQEKEGKEVTGFNLMLNVEKSRYCTEKSVFPIELRFDGGLNKYTGLLTVALKVGNVIKPSNGWYSRVIDGVTEDKKWRAKDTNSKEFWNDLLSNDEFKEKVRVAYSISNGKLIKDEDDNIDDNVTDVTSLDDIEFTTE